MRWLMICGFVLFMGLPMAASAGSETSTPAAAAPAAKVAPPSDFAPMDPKKKDDVNAPLMVVLAYGSILALLLGYVVHVARGQSRVSTELQAMGRRLDEKDG